MKRNPTVVLLLLGALGCPESNSGAPTKSPSKAVDPGAEAGPAPSTPSPAPTQAATPKPTPESLNLLDRMDNKIMEVDSRIGKPVDKSAKDEPRPRASAPSARQPRAAARGQAPIARRPWVTRTISTGERVNLSSYLQSGRLVVVEFYADW